MAETKSADQKAVFTMTDQMIYSNLHASASENAAKKIGWNPDDKSISQFILNTICSDGSYMTDAVPEKKSVGGKNEMGIILELADLTNLAQLSVQLAPSATGGSIPNEMTDAIDKNKKTISKARNDILNGIREYFKWFAGNDKIAEDDLVLYIPQYTGGKIRASNTLEPMDKQNEFFSMYDPDAPVKYWEKFEAKASAGATSAGTGVVSGAPADKIKDFIKKYGPEYSQPDKNVVRFGYKVGYTID